MSSIASPTTTMRWPAIFPSSRSTWSRESRVSGTGVVIGASGSREPGAGSRMLPRTGTPCSLLPAPRALSWHRPLPPEPIAHPHRSDEVGAGVPRRVLEVRDVMHSGIERDAELVARRVAPGQRRAQRALDDALKD